MWRWESEGSQRQRGRTERTGPAGVKLGKEERGEAELISRTPLGGLEQRRAIPVRMQRGGGDTRLLRIGICSHRSKYSHGQQQTAEDLLVL